MASTRPVSGDDVDGVGVDLLGSAAALRWSRPDLTGAIADHVLEIADSDADDVRWLQAAGWAVYARSATGDGRDVASDVLDGVARRGAHVLDEPAADRLRVELAVLASGAGRLATARTLLTPVAVADTVPELRADALCALSRCAVQDRPAAVGGLLRRVEETWAEIGGRRGHIGTAAAALVAAAAERRAGRPDMAVHRAAAGLAALEGARGSRPQSPSHHLAAGLAAEWLAGLLDAGRLAEARDGCVPMEPRLRDTSRPSRQIALLRLTVARAMTGSGASAVADAVAQAARDAVASDAPDLESVCSSTLGALQQKSGQLDEALASRGRGEAAQRRDEARAGRFRAALDALVSAEPGHRIAVGREPDHRQEPLRVNGGPGRNGARHRTDPPADTSAWTDWSSAVARDRTVPPSTRDIANGGNPNLRENGAVGHDASSGSQRAASSGNGHAGASSSAAEQESASPWRGWTDDSPIGRLLARSLEPEDGGEPAAQPVRKMPDGARPPRRYPDAVTDPWSTGSWSTGHWATSDRSAGGVPNDSGRDRSVDGPPAGSGGRAGRRRRAEPEDDLTTTAAPGPSGVGPAEHDGTGSSAWAGGRSDLGPDLDGGRAAAGGSAARERGSSGHHAADELLGAEDTVSWSGRAAGDLSGRDVSGRDVSGRDVSGRDATGRAGTTGWATGDWATSDRAAAERAAAAEHVEAERNAAERAAAERVAAERAAAERVAAERAAAARVAAERAATDRIAAERDAAERAAAERAAAERAAAERAAAERAASERAAAERAAADDAAAERLALVERDAELAVETGSSSWLQNALAELDRALGMTRAPVEGGPAAPAPEAEGCVVVVDLARDGRRFAGRRAGGVVRALADRLTDRLPAGARLRHDDSDALSVLLPGWTRSPATEWMHRTLPGLFEEFVTDEDLPGTQLRAAVHDTDGPVGAQLLQRLDSPRRGRSSADALTDGTLRDTMPTTTPEQAAEGGRRHRRASEDGPDVPADADGNGSAAVRSESAVATDGLGLADLLAGALAAYRGI